MTTLKITIGVLALLGCAINAVVVGWPAPPFVVGLVQGGIMAAAFYAGQFYGAMRHIDEMHYRGRDWTEAAAKPRTWWPD